MGNDDEKEELQWLNTSSAKQSPATGFLKCDDKLQWLMVGGNSASATNKSTFVDEISMCHIAQTELSFWLKSSSAAPISTVQFKDMFDLLDNKGCIWLKQEACNPMQTAMPTCIPLSSEFKQNLEKMRWLNTEKVQICTPENNVDSLITSTEQTNEASETTTPIKKYYSDMCEVNGSPRIKRSRDQSFDSSQLSDWLFQTHI